MQIKIPNTIRINIHQEENGTYWAESVDVPGCFTVGKTIDETLKNMQDAVKTHFGLTKQEKIQTDTQLLARLSFT